MSTSRSYSPAGPLGRWLLVPGYFKSCLARCFRSSKNSRILLFPYPLIGRVGVPKNIPAEEAAISTLIGECAMILPTVSIE
jgi:hypothetical protein